MVIYVGCEDQPVDQSLGCFALGGALDLGEDIDLGVVPEDAVQLRNMHIF